MGPPKEITVSNRVKTIGVANFEVPVRKALTNMLPSAYKHIVVKPAQASFADVGDLHAGPFAFQLKNVASGTKTVDGFLSDAVKQADRAGLPFAAAIVSRPGQGANNPMVVMDLETFAILLGLALEAGVSSVV